MGTVGELLDRFCGEARLWGEACRDGRLDIDDRMSPLWDQLVELEAGAAITALLDHPAVAVRYCAAARLHRFDWRRAREVMEPIAAERPPLGIFASRLLDRWANGDVEWRRVAMGFSGTVIDSDYLGRCTRAFVATHFDPRFAVTIEVDEPPAEGPFGFGVTTFAVHSLVKSFCCGRDEIAGKRMRFEADACERGGVWRIRWLRGRPV